MSVYSKLQASGNYFQLNKTLIAKLGVDEAVLLCLLADEENYWETVDKLNTDKYFFSTIENVESKLGFKCDKQRKLLSSLQDRGIIDIDYRGMPKKRYIKINDNVIFNLLN